MSEAAYEIISGVSGRRDQSARCNFLSTLMPKYFSNSGPRPTEGSPSNWAAIRVSKTHFARKP